MKFRYHRGSLQDSLVTAVSFNTLDELKTHIMETHCMLLIDDILNMDFLLSHYGYDERVQQDLWLLRIDYAPVGFVYDLGDVAEPYPRDEEFIWDQITSKSYESVKV